MNEHPTSSMETGSDDAVLGQFLRDLDGAPDDAAFADIVARARALHPGRDEEFDALASGLARLRGLRDPDRLGPYRVRRVLAVGGMGKLYEAVEDKLGRVVVVKTIKSSRAADPHYQDRFDRERRAWRGCTTPTSSPSTRPGRSPASSTSRCPASTARRSGL